jgi:hypothetical protein
VERKKSRNRGRDPKETRERMQKNNAPTYNQPKGTKKGRPEEANFVTKQVS